MDLMHLNHNWIENSDFSFQIVVYPHVPRKTWLFNYVSFWAVLSSVMSFWFWVGILISLAYTNKVLM